MKRHSLMLPLILLSVFWSTSHSAQNKLWNNGNGAMIDVTTGLMWQSISPSEKMRLFQAFEYCNGLSLSGSSNWRVPTLKEWFSLIDFGRRQPYYDVKNFPDLAKFNIYFSSSFYDDGPFRDFYHPIWLASATIRQASSPTDTTIEGVRCVADVPLPDPTG